MTKRIIATLTICLIITGLINPVISHAEPVPIYTPNWSDPGIAEIIDISDLTGWMANGGVFDITDFQDLEEFLSWYFKIRVPMKDENGEIYFAPYYGYDYSLTSPDPDIPLKFNKQSQIRGMIKRVYQNKIGYGRRLQEQVDKALLNDGNLSNINIPLLDLSEAAFFVGYDTNAIHNYSQSFYSDSPAANPDPNYPFINYLNTLYYTSSNGTVYNVKDLGIEYHRTNASGIFYCISNDGSYVGADFTHNHVADNNNQTCSFSYFDKIRIDIDSSNPNNVTANYSHYPFTQKQLFDYLVPTSNTYYDLWVYENIQNVVVNGGGLYQYTQSSFTSLTGALQYVYQHYSNIDLYVDGVAWALSGNTTPIIPEFPDVVGGDELPTTTWPLTYPKAPSYINLPGLRQAFQRAKNTDNKFDIMDLKDSLVDPEGDPIIDPELDNVPVPLPNPDPINPEVVPELPDLPLIPPANNPGFNGVTVLAEIINFTNQSLPSSLITVFWGIIFGTVVLGIIKILHK